MRDSKYKNWRYLYVPLLSFIKVSSNIRLYIGFLVWACAVLAILLFSSDQEVWGQYFVVAVYSVFIIFAWMAYKVIWLVPKIWQMPFKYRYVVASVTYIYGRLGGVVRYKYAVSGQEYYGVTFSHDLSVGSKVKCAYHKDYPAVSLRDEAFGFRFLCYLSGVKLEGMELDD